MRTGRVHMCMPLHAHMNTALPFAARRRAQMVDYFVSQGLKPPLWDRPDAALASFHFFPFLSISLSSQQNSKPPLWDRPDAAFYALRPAAPA